MCDDHDHMFDDHDDTYDDHDEMYDDHDHTCDDYDELPAVYPFSRRASRPGSDFDFSRLKAPSSSSASDFIGACKNILLRLAKIFYSGLQKYLHFPRLLL